MKVEKDKSNENRRQIFKREYRERLHLELVQINSLPTFTNRDF